MDQLNQAGDLTGYQEPVWLQIGRGAQQLAALPWEAMVSRRLNPALLRIPNFLVNPFQPGKIRRIAICASGPLAKGAEEVFEHISQLLSVFQNIFAQEPLVPEKPKPQVAIFTDVDAFWDLQWRLDELRDQHERLDIDIPNPESADEFDRPERARGPIRQSPKLTNPWLQWIVQYYSSTGVDAMHFISPGYFYDENGALALAESPMRNTDRYWSRFVAAQELAVFYDRLGCSVMGFTTIGDIIWHIGTRMLAYELSWIRPGPVLVAEPYGDIRPLVNAYGALFRCLEYDAHIASDLQFYVHPDAVFQPDVDYPHTAFLTKDSEFNIEVLAIELGDDKARAITPSISLESPELFVRSYGHGGNERSPEQDFKQQILRSEVASLSGVRAKSEIEEVQNKGALRALDFIARVTQKD